MNISLKPLNYESGLIPRREMELIFNKYFNGKYILIPFLGEGENIMPLNIKSPTSPKALIKFNKKTYIVKQIPWYCDDVAKIEIQMKFQKYLRDRGLELPDIIKTINGESYIKFGSKKFFMSKYQKNEGYKRDTHTAKSAGQYIARMHNHSSTYKITKNIGSENAKTIVKKTLKLIKENKNYKILKDKLLAIKIPKEYSKIKFVCHGDLNPSNFLFKNKKINGLVDFDNITYDNPARDLSEAILTFSLIEYFENSSKITRINKKINKKICKALIEGYANEAPEIYNKIKKVVPVLSEIVLIELFCIGLLRNDLDKNKPIAYDKEIFLDIKNIIETCDLTKGIHIMDTFSTKRMKKLKKSENIMKSLRNIIIKEKLNILNEKFHDFNPGYTGYWLLKESHISLHSWPEKNKLQLDIFVCNYNKNNSEKAKNIYSDFKKYFKAKSTNKQLIYRQ